ncbi:hypothetical protein ACLOJK_033954 [Asimina triloba]
MHVGSVMLSSPTQTPVHACRATPCRRLSHLNPLRSTRASLQTLPTADSTTRIHLAHLEKLLQITPDQPHPEPPKTDSGQLPPPQNRGRGFLEALNLARIWPSAARQAEEMSPRHLRSLQRLLSNKSVEYSPKNHLSSRWRDYHGLNNWAGLLDPLDENLRREVVRYGEFVQAAYHAFHSHSHPHPSTSTAVAAPPSPSHVPLPDRTYRVTKSLYATSSVGLPAWVDEVAPELEWMTQRSSWIGYVAVCDDDREIARMGRRDVVIALRGTSTCLEWAENLRAGMVEIPSAAAEKAASAAEGTNPKVECGFWSLYKTPGAHVQSLSVAIVVEIRRLMELYEGEQLSISVTGHSLGAALALLVADELSTCATQVPPIAVFSFGGPRVGNRGFAERVEGEGVKVLRVVNAQDVITRVPGVPVVGESHVREDLPWAYSHVGTELRVDSRMSPYLKPNADVACCHDLEAYLHLVDGFLASNCPFRANAKRSLARLLHEQGSNMKKRYTSKDLALNLETVMVGPSPGGCLPSPS